MVYHTINISACDRAKQSSPDFKEKKSLLCIMFFKISISEGWRDVFSYYKWAVFTGYYWRVPQSKEAGFEY